MAIGSPLETILNGYDKQASIYAALQGNLSQISALNSGFATSSGTNPIAQLTIDSFRLSQMAQGNRQQMGLAENILKENQREQQKIINDLGFA
jgi:hypothetical protein